MESKLPNLLVDLGARRVWREGKELDLTRLEFETLSYLARRAGRVVPYAELWQQIWGGSGPFEETEREMVRAIIKRLSRKLRDDLEEPAYLLRARGVGVGLRRRAVKVKRR